MAQPPITLKEYTIENARNVDAPYSYPGQDNGWSFEKFKKNFRVDFVDVNYLYESVEFDMVGVDVSIANSIRRILIAEVPTMAIEKVYIYNNTSLIQDEVLAHRLGLIPIFADPRNFEFLPESDGNLYDNPSPDHMLEFRLKVKCTRNPLAPKDSDDPKELYQNYKVTSDDMKWVPIGTQADKFSVHDIRPVHNDILIAKLRPGQEIDVRLLCIKGIGKDHAKFSPVAPASYRLLPQITLTRPVVGPQADKLARCFPKGVIKISTVNGQRVASVDNPRLDTCSREVLRHEDLKDAVALNKVRDHFIFTVESTGALSADTLVIEALNTLMNKCDMVLSYLDKLET